MPSSMEDFISKGLFLMSLKDLNQSSKSTVITALGLRAKEKTSSNFHFQPVFKFVNSEAKYKKIFKEDGGIEECLQKFLFAGEELTIENYKSVMKFAPMIEFWDEYRVAQTNTKPNDTFFANIIIDDEQIDFVYREKIVGNPLRISIGKQIKCTTTQGNQINVVVTDILDDQLILKKCDKQPRRLGRREKVPLNRVYFMPNDLNFLNICSGISALKTKHLQILFPYNDLTIYLTNNNELPDKLCWETSNELGLKTDLNVEQRRVVSRILNRKSPHPFILFGPPGTGKTKTLCESIKQLYMKNKSLKEQLIIVAAPSNTAIDIIVKDLVKSVPQNEILRLVSKARSKRGIDNDIKPVSTDFIEDVYKSLRKGDLKILCGTLQVLGKVEPSNIKASHIFVDEAGQASEGEVLVVWPILANETCSENGQLILAGDPHQLGPVVMTEGAKYLGHGKSMMQRLMEFPLYGRKANEGNFDEKFVIQLVKNYRSLPLLLEVPDKLFYGKKLEAKFKPSKEMISPSIFGSTKSPSIFFAVYTAHKRAGTSSQNKGQANVVLRCVERLLKNNVAKSDIGIITPYAAQVRLIQDMLIQRGLVQRPRLNQESSHNDGIIIGSVERFQGNERKVIILSTVRSKGEGMGFLKDYQRFNVAITRAKELLLVIGDPQVLLTDKNWRELINHTRKQKSYFEGLPNDPAIVQQAVSSNALVGFQKTTPIGSDEYASYGSFGGSNGFYRGRGRGVNKSYRGRGGGRGGFQSERPTVNPNRESLKFEGEYDFEKANEEFKVMLTAELR